MNSFTIPNSVFTQFLINLLSIHSPTGYTHEASEFTRKAFADLNIPNLSISQEPKGALLLKWQGKTNTAPRGVTAHLDTLGLMVKEIKSNGALKVVNLGGIMWHGIEFENVTVQTYDGKRYRGTMIPINPSSHVNPDIEKSARNPDTMEVRLDLKTTSADTTRSFGIEVGNFVFLDTRTEVIESGFIRSRFLDNKAGVAVIYAAVLAMRDAGIQPAQDMTFHIANYEEVGHGGASGFPAGLHEVLAIDMGALGNGQNGDEFNVSICVKDSSGPYHYDMVNKLRQLCQTHSIPYKTDIYPFYASDGSAYWRSGGNAKVGLMGPGVASSHSYERTHMETLEHSTHLLIRYLVDDTLA
jgi:putative aminopeptidase FrvX